MYMKLRGMVGKIWFQTVGGGRVGVRSKFRFGFEGGGGAQSALEDRHQLWITRPGIELAPVCVSPSTWSIVNVEG